MMDKNTTKLFFALLRSAVINEKLTEDEIALYSDGVLPELLKTASEHDIVAMLAAGLKNNDLAKSSRGAYENEIMRAVYRYRQLKYDYDKLCAALEAAEIAFLPLKGSVIRRYYDCPWMRTSCDVDILLHPEDIEKASEYLKRELGYRDDVRTPHDVSFYTKQGVHIELHFDLVEEGRANRANEILSDVWKNVSLREGTRYFYEMSDEYFYFYHIAHMAKHLEVGGCGIRPFIDLLILDHIDFGGCVERDALLKRGELLKFADSARNLSRVWFASEVADTVSEKMQNYILHGGVYGSIDNRVMAQQNRRGGRLGYVISRIFLPYSRLKGLYPILEKHKWLTPFMQVRRWFMIFKPGVRERTKSELAANKNADKTATKEMNKFFTEIGI